MNTIEKQRTAVNQGDRLTREELEQAALKAAPADLYYDLYDQLDSTTDAELMEIIAEGEAARAH